jgi:CRP-like cAMP-binding protein
VVLDLIRSDPESAASVLAVMARQLQEVRQRLELRNVRSARDRIMLYLELKADPDGLVAVGGELQDIAADLGLTREALYRTLATLEQDGAIKRDGTGLVLKRRLGA